MGKSEQKVDVPDLNDIVRMEKELNRVDSITPFGQSVWDGNRQVTSLSPEMQGASDRMFALLEQGQQRIEPPPFMNDLFGAVAGRVGERYGLSGMDTSKPQASMQPPQMSLPPDLMPGNGIDGNAPMPVQPNPDGTPPWMPLPPINPGNFVPLGAGRIGLGSARRPGGRREEDDRPPNDTIFT